jgi:hypothetical protein
LGLTVCTGRAADFGAGAAISGDGADTTATVVLGFAAAVLTDGTRAGAAAGAVLATGLSLLATASGRVALCLAALAGGLLATGRIVGLKADGLEAALLTLRATVLAVLPVVFAAAFGRAGAFALETIGFDPFMPPSLALASQTGLEPLKNCFAG